MKTAYISKKKASYASNEGIHTQDIKKKARKFKYPLRTLQDDESLNWKSNHCKNQAN